MEVPKKLPVFIACGSSDSYAMQLTVSLHSALTNIAPDRPVHAFVMDGGISQGNIARIRRILAKARPSAKIEVIRPEGGALTGLPTTGRYPAAVYFRLLMDAILPESVERVLYIDADVVVTEDVSPLFDMDLGTKALWAVRDPNGPGKDGLPRLRRDFPSIPLSEDAVYFNGGVMLINLPEWRKRRVSERVIELIREHGTRFKHFEQDPMNFVLDHDWGALDEKWNNIIQGQVLTFPKRPGSEPGDGILHFAGRRFKPWHWGGRCLHEETYLAAMRATGWHTPLERVQLEAYRAVKGLKARLAAVLPARGAGALPRAVGGG